MSLLNQSFLGRLDCFSVIVVTVLAGIFIISEGFAQ